MRLLISALGIAPAILAAALVTAWSAGPPGGILPGTMDRHGSVQGYSLAYHLLE